MIERDLDVPTADGAMNTFVVHPDEGGPFPVVLFYMDAPGKREELHDMARRIASVGYFVVLPNLYYRKSRDYFLRERTDEGFAEMFTYMDALDRSSVERDTAAMLRFVDAEPMADRQRVGAVGYCMSGPFVIWAAAAFPERLRCIASIYGARLVTDAPDSAHRMLDKVRCETYFACAETDKWAPPAIVEQLRSALDAAGTNYRLEWYPGAEHGFAFPLRAGIYHKPSAEQHWQRLFSLFARNLGGGRRAGA
ncbi:MAG TPA: dienelactone hydrolase family protein [Caldimonas sp.]